MLSVAQYEDPLTTCASVVSLDDHILVTASPHHHQHSTSSGVGASREPINHCFESCIHLIMIGLRPRRLQLVLRPPSDSYPLQSRSIDPGLREVSMTGTQPSWDGLQRYVGTAPIAMVLRFEAKVPGAPGVLREPGATPDLRSPSVSRAKLDEGRRAWVVGPVWRVTSLQLWG
jgi:hypothetical protein